MNLAPRNKTAIISFIIDEAFSNLCNVSLLMRKRIQMILEDRNVTVNKYKDKLAELNKPMRIGKYDKIIESTSDIKKGVFNYTFKTTAQIEKFLSLNKKLSCYFLSAKPRIITEIDEIGFLSLNSTNYVCYSKFVFNRVRKLVLINLSPSQTKQILSKIKQIGFLSFEFCELSGLDLSSLRIQKINFFCVRLNGTVDLPSCFKYLSINECFGLMDLNCKKMEEVCFYTHYGETENSLRLVSKLKNLRKLSISLEMSKLIDYLPSTIRYLRFSEFGLNDVDLQQIKEKLPFLVEINQTVPIEAAKTLGLRKICPEINRSEEIFAYRPRKIKIDKQNREGLSKHPELFKKVEKIWTDCKMFKLDFLPKNVKNIEFRHKYIDEESLSSFKKNAWKFEEAKLKIWCEEEITKEILNSVKKAKMILIRVDFRHLVEEYRQLKLKAIL